MAARNERQPRHQREQQHIAERIGREDEPLECRPTVGPCGLDEKPPRGKGRGAAEGDAVEQTVARVRQPLLPDEPPAPARQPVLDEDTLETLLDAGDVVANESAPCPSCKRTTYQALHRDGSRRCWTCGVTTLAGAA